MAHRMNGLASVTCLDAFAAWFLTRSMSRSAHSWLLASKLSPRISSGMPPGPGSQPSSGDAIIHKKPNTSISSTLVLCFMHPVYLRRSANIYVVINTVSFYGAAIAVIGLRAYTATIRVWKTKTGINMSLISEPMWISKEVSHHAAVRYQSRVVHEINPIQREFVDTYKHLQETTDHIVDYIPVGRLGVVLAGLDPVIKQIISTDRRGNINEAARRELECDINEALPDMRQTVVRTSGGARPFALYGADKQELGIKLSTSDPVLFGERVLVERFIRDEHPRASNRFGEELLNWQPHIRIGFIRPGVLDAEQLQELHDDPTGYIENAMHQTHQNMQERYGIPVECRELVIPDELVLGGLKIVCDKQANRIF